METDNEAGLPVADAAFFEVFMPYEIRLTQRRAMTYPTAEEEASSSCTGLYLVQSSYGEGSRLPDDSEGGAELRHHVENIVRKALRDSDILGHLADDELLAVVRDLDPSQSYIVAQRILTACNRSDLLRAAGVGIHVGYLVYPLSGQPNFPPLQWSQLIRLARSLGDSSSDATRGTGFGLLRGPASTTTSLPETDLVDLAFEDLSSLVDAGLLTLQRLHLISSF